MGSNVVGFTTGVNVALLTMTEGGNDEAAGSSNP